MAVDELPRWWRGWHRRRSGNINLLIAIATGLLGIYIYMYKKTYSNSELLFTQIDDRLSRRVESKRAFFLLTPTCPTELSPSLLAFCMHHVYIALLIIMNNYLDATSHYPICSSLWEAIDHKLRRIIKSDRVEPLIF